MSPDTSFFVDQWKPWDVKCQHLWRKRLCLHLCVLKSLFEVMFWMDMKNSCMYEMLKASYTARCVFRDLNCQKQHNGNAARRLKVFVAVLEYTFPYVNMRVHACVELHKVYDSSNEWRKGGKIDVLLKKHPTSSGAHNLFTSTCKVSLVWLGDNDLMMDYDLCCSSYDGRCNYWGQ